jgi:hypothetical protein
MGTSAQFRAEYSYGLRNLQPIRLATLDVCTVRIISYGGGVQSTAMVIMAAKRDPDFEKACGGPIDAAVFSNVGDDSEQPHTLKYVREIIIPWADSLGFPVEIVNKTKKDGTEAETLMQKMMKDGSVSFPIPIRIGDGRPALRACTVDYKIKVIEKYVRQHGATKDNKAVVAIGISIDEFQRIASNRESNYETKIYPLIDLNMNRADCQAVPESVGLPRPGKSACFFCPFHRAMEWSELRRDQPELFQKSLELENRINEVRKAQDKDPAYLTSRGKPLDQAIGEAQDQLPGFESIEEAGCDSGHCFT